MSRLNGYPVVERNELRNLRASVSKAHEEKRIEARNRLCRQHDDLFLRCWNREMT